MASKNVPEIWMQGIWLGGRRPAREGTRAVGVGY